MCGCEVDVEDEVLIAFRADEGDAKGGNGGGEGASERFDGGSKGGHCGEMPGSNVLRLTEHTPTPEASKLEEQRVGPKK